MTHLKIDNKRYILVQEESYEELQKNEDLKRNNEKKFSIDEARKYSKKFIEKLSSKK